MGFKANTISSSNRSRWKATACSSMGSSSDSLENREVNSKYLYFLIIEDIEKKIEFDPVPSTGSLPANLIFENGYVAYRD